MPPRAPLLVLHMEFYHKITVVEVVFSASGLFMSPQQRLLYCLFVRSLSPVISFIFVEFKYIFIMYCNTKIVRSSPLSFVTTIWTGRLRNRSSILGRDRILPPYLVENCRDLQIPLCGRCRGQLPRVKAARREAIHTPLYCVHIQNVWLHYLPSVICASACRSTNFARTVERKVTWFPANAGEKP
jgi:hypothetical protein